MKKERFLKILQSDIKEGFITHEDQEIDNLSFSIIGNILIMTNNDDVNGNSKADKWNSKKNHKEETKENAELYIKDFLIKEQEVEKYINYINDKQL